MANSRSTQPRKQRRVSFNASPFDRHRQMTVSLSRELRKRYQRRALPLRKGDTVRIISGSFQGREERVSKVDMRTLRITLDNVTIKKVDQKLKPLPIRSSHLILTRLNLADPWRRKILKVSAAEVPAEEAPAEAAESTPALPASEPRPEGSESTDVAPDAGGTEPETVAPEPEEPASPARKKRKAKAASEDDE
jgi:large subunit ribosomal protein L24